MPRVKAGTDSPAEVENLLNDMQDALASKDLDAVPEIKALRERIEESLAAARATALDAAKEAAQKAREAAEQAAQKAREAARAADEYAHDEPWQVAGAALALGAVIGYLLGRRS